MDISFRGSRVTSRTVVLNGHRTSIRLEPQFWDGLDHIAEYEGVSRGILLEKIFEEVDKTSFSSAVRVFVVSYYARLLKNDPPSPPGNGSAIAVMG